MEKWEYWVVPLCLKFFWKINQYFEYHKKKNILSVSVPRKRRKNIQNSNPHFIFPRKLGTRQIKISNLKIILSSPTAKALTCMYVISREIQTKTKGDGREPVIFLVQKASWIYEAIGSGDLEKVYYIIFYL